MHKSNIIVFPGAEAAAQPKPARPSRPAGDLGMRILLGVEAVVTAVIGLGIVTCTVAVLFLV